MTPLVFRRLKVGDQVSNGTRTFTVTNKNPAGGLADGDSFFVKDNDNGDEGTLDIGDAGDYTKV
ncbi:MAG TPA: hypothetical protein VLI05_00555 [Candidatus Saccharimonadia bacterium]|nr:hypothetical protein [Candidatus Saccharimonadia bacterium]